jgi:diguanylate cyclase (GGDEF)-like protein
MDAEKKNSLLIVDDEKVNLKILSHILGEDYIIYTATNGLNAIEKAIECQPELILLDIMMPGIDGYETLAKIKADDKIKHIPVIFVSGLDSHEDEEKGLALSAVDYITKPFSARIVKLRVQNQMQIIDHVRTIENISMKDQLTQIANRRCFDERLQMEWKQAIREQTPISILMMDLDRFKILNDTYGHQQGDIVLQMVAEMFPKSFKRAGDFAARWGGEEFVALLPNTCIEGAMEIAEDIRADIEKTELVSSCGAALKITISIGVNSIIPMQNSPVDSFIFGADKALFEAKETGRNRVIQYLNPLS